ncbi:hypothetical protein C8R44DRAFT_750268 [Mycena epipterygia]|nr:hypothetical protein C8R44DRAFT_750268 [Mycena epipterygia]
MCSLDSFWFPTAHPSQQLLAPILKHNHVALRFIPQTAYEAPRTWKSDVVVHVFMIFKSVAELVVAVDEWNAEAGPGDPACWREVVGVDVGCAGNAGSFRVLEWGGNSFCVYSVLVKTDERVPIVSMRAAGKTLVGLGCLAKVFGLNYYNLKLSSKRKEKKNGSGPCRSSALPSTHFIMIWRAVSILHVTNRVMAINGDIASCQRRLCSAHHALHIASAARAGRRDHRLNANQNLLNRN